LIRPPDQQELLLQLQFPGTGWCRSGKSSKIKVQNSKAKVKGLMIVNH
jgi:hypothetical protein